MGAVGTCEQSNYKTDRHLVFGSATMCETAEYKFGPRSLRLAVETYRALAGNGARL